MENANFKNVLFINYGGIGDEILFLPAIQGFKKIFPNSKITLAQEPRAKGIKTLSPLIDEVLEVDIKTCGIKKYLNLLKFIFKARKLKFDMVISSGKSPFVAIILFLTGIKTKIGYKSKLSCLLTKAIPLNENCYAGNMYFDLIGHFGAPFELPKILYDKNFKLPEAFTEGDFTLIHPGVSLMSVRKNIFKCPDKIFWIELIKQLLKRGEKILLAGSKDDETIISSILADSEIRENKNFCSMFNKTKNLYEMAGLIKKSKTLICCDSAPLHLGVSLGANIIVLFGPTNELKLVPEAPNIKIVSKNLKCRPCLWHRRNYNCENSDCIKFNTDDVLNLMK